MPKIELALDDKDVTQAVRDYIFKLGYTVKSQIPPIKLEVPITVTVERHYPSYGGCDKS